MPQFFDPLQLRHAKKSFDDFLQTVALQAGLQTAPGATARESLLNFFIVFDARVAEATARAEKKAAARATADALPTATSSEPVPGSSTNTPVALPSAGEDTIPFTAADLTPEDYAEIRRFDALYNR